MTYSPATDFFGAETFTYTAGNTTGSVQGTVVVQVHPLNDDPTAANDALTVDANSTSVFLDLLQNDSFAPDTGEQLEIIAIGLTDQNGQVALGPNGTHVLYTPAADFNGAESFNYTISDGNNGQAVGTVTVQVGESNDGSAPTANADALTVGEDSTSEVLDVLANDTLGTGGGSLVITAVGTPAQGGAVQLATDSLTLVYTPAADFFGDEVISYTVGDGNGGSATGQVTVTVTGANDVPNANDDTLTAIKNAVDQVLSPLANDTITPDEGESLSITAVGTPDQGGTVTIATNGQTILYTPATDFVAQETFTYTIDDGNGGTSQGTVTVDVLDYIPSKLAGSVYLDSNNDGLQDAQEMVLSGVTVTLEGTDFNSVAVSQTLTTNSQGDYEFADLAPGSYVISQLQPAYLIDGQDSVGSQGGSISQDNQITVELTEDTDGVDNNFAERGREASTFTLADFFGSARDASLVGSFGEQPAEQWVALDASWNGYETTEVSWFENSHTLVIDVIEADAAANSAVLSWEAGHAVRQLGNDLSFPMITVEDEAAALGFTAGSSS
ncbi:MAG: Ig-like domain-containing protein, partial [Pirellulaceae bacterium]